MRLAEFAYTAPPVPGAGKLMQPYRLPKDREQEAILRSKDALYGRTTYYTGPSPSYISTYPGSLMTPEKLHSIFNQVLTTGWMFNKACLDEQIFLRDAHITAVDTSFRVASVGKKFTIQPADGSELAQNIANYHQTVVDDIDHFDESAKRLLYAYAGGYAVEEPVYNDKEIKFPIGRDRTVTICGPHPKQLDWVSNKSTRFDVATDELLLDMGGGKFASLPEWKFVVHVTPGDFQVRRRGYMYQAAWLSMFKNSAIARWAAILDIWGIPVPYGMASQELWQDETRKEQLHALIRDHGLGNPAIFTDDFRVERSPNISEGDARGMHAAIIGWINTELSKLIQGETLTTELGGVGSYNASETHAAVKESIVAMAARALSNTVRKFLREFTKLNIDQLSQALGASPSEILRLTGRPYWRIEREVTTKDRMQLYVQAVNELGMNIDEDQPYEEFGFAKARDPNKRLNGKAQILSADAKAVSNASAVEGVENPKPEEATGIIPPLEDNLSTPLVNNT